jgi:hypothetical protein
MIMRQHWTFVAVLSLVGCTGDIGGGDDDGSGSGSDDPIVCEQARTYTGFGGADLAGTRPAIEPGSDRLRLKPYVALSAEYRAALGLTAFDTAAYAATFGRPPARWFQEPAASANTVYAAFALAFAACTQQTAADSRYAAAPDPASADINCREYARRSWHREATDAEAATCVSYAVDKTNPADAPAKRWSYACAAVLSASGFLAY